jgi:hypothetical protein
MDIDTVEHLRTLYPAPKEAPAETREEMLARYAADL